MVNREMGKIKFRLNNEKFTFNVFQSMKKLKYNHVLSVIDIVDEDGLIACIKERLGVKGLVEMIMNFDSDNINEYDELVINFIGIGSYSYAPKKLDLQLKKRATLPTRPSIKETSGIEVGGHPISFALSIFGDQQ